MRLKSTFVVAALLALPVSLVPGGAHGAALNAKAYESTGTLTLERQEGDPKARYFWSMSGKETEKASALKEKGKETADSKASGELTTYRMVGKEVIGEGKGTFSMTWADGSKSKGTVAAKEIGPREIVAAYQIKEGYGKGGVITEVCEVDKTGKKYQCEKVFTHA